MAAAGTLEIQLLANIARLQTDMNSATRSVGGAMSSIEKTVNRAKQAFIGLAAGMGVRQVLAFADAWGQLSSRMALSTGSMQDGNTALMRLADLSNRVYKPLEATSELFISTSKTLGEMGYSSEQTMAMVEALSYSLTVSGADAQKSASVMSAWSKALLVGKMGMEELTTVITGAPRLQEALAKSLDTTNAGLMQIVLSGNLSADMMMKVGEQAVQLGKETDQMPVSMADSFTKMGNSLMLFFGRADSGFGIIEALTSAMGTFSDGIMNASKWIEANVVTTDRLSAAFLTATKITAAYFAVVVAAPAIYLSIAGAITAATAALNLYIYNMGASIPLAFGLNTVLFGTSVAANLAAGSLTLLRLAALSLFAAFAGWQIGTYLSEQFQEVRLAGLAFVGAMMIGFQNVKTDALLVGAAIKSLLPGTESYTIAKARLMAEYQKETDKIDENIISLMAYEMSVKSVAAEEVKAVATKSSVVILTEAQIEAAKAAEKVFEASAKQARNFITSLQEQTAELGLSEQQVRMMTAAREAALAPTAALRLEIMQTALANAIATQADKDAKEATEALAAAKKVLVDAEAQRVKQYVDSIPAMAEANQAIREETELLGLTSEEQLLVTQAREASIIAIKEEQLARLQNTEVAGLEQVALAEEIKLLKERMGLNKARSDKNIAVEQAKEASAEWKRTSDNIERELTASLFRAFDAGKGFFSTLWNGIKNLFKTTVLQLLISPVTKAISGIAAGAFSSMANASDDNPLTSTGGIMNMLTSSNKAIYSSISSVGAWMEQSTIQMTQDIGTFTRLNSEAIGKGFAYAGALIALSQGKFATAAGTAIGTAFGGPIGGAIGGAIGGMLEGVFGRGPKKVNASGISGNYSASGATGLQNYSSWSQKGGWFSSGKSGTNYSALDGGTNSAINDAVLATGNAVRSYASAIGLSADAVNGFSQSIKVSLMGLSAADAQAAVEASITNFGEAMATAAYGAVLQSYRLAGEDITDTLIRLSSSLMTVNQTFATMGKSLMATSLAGADAASNLVALAGGIEAFNSQSNAYYAAFYSQTERTETATRQLTTALNLMGEGMPASRDAFRQLVDAQDLMTASGRATYAVLIALAPAFDEITTSTAAIEASLASLASSTANSIIDASVMINSTAMDFDKLSDSLDGIDTRTFIATVTGLFSVIGDRIIEILGNISDERISLRDAERGIIGGAGITPSQISQQITDSMVGLPSNSAVRSNQSALAMADAKASATAASAALAKSAYGKTLSDQANNQRSILGGLNSTIAPRTTAPGQTSNAIWESIIGPQWQAHVNRFGIGWNTDRTNDNERAANMDFMAGQYTQRVNESNVPVYAAAAAQLIADQVKVDSAYKASSVAAAIAATDIASQAVAATAAKNAQLAYIASLQQYAIDASKAVSQLGKLRQETVNYYETQKQLADLMLSSASSLRQTVADYQFGMMSPEDQLGKLQEQFNTAYSMAISTSGDALVGYGDQMNSLINPLLQSAVEAGLSNTEYASLISNTLARADAVALRLDAMAPADYQLESLGLLAQIDATLAALEAGALTADQIVVNAIKAGADTTANGLRAVIAAITGTAIPAFATGGTHTGGLRIVGENGPELEATGPSRIFNNSQTRGMFAGGADNSEVVAELRALRHDNANMRTELQAIAGFTNKSAKILDRWDGDGAPVRVATGETFAVESTTVGA
jgi:tape measure domain-containing protein